MSQIALVIHVAYVALVVHVAYVALVVHVVYVALGTSANKGTNVTKGTKAAHPDQLFVKISLTSTPHRAIMYYDGKSSRTFHD